VQLTRRLAWLGLALLEERDLVDDEERESAPVQIEVHAEPASPSAVVPKRMTPPAAASTAPVPAPLDSFSGEQGAAPAEAHLRSASRAYAASQLRSNVEMLTGDDAPKADRPSRRPPLASA
jgi:hypothetical protein